MKKFIKKGIIFILLLVIILVIKKLITPYYLGNRTYKDKLEYFNNNYNNEKYNTVFFGSSRIYRHINSALFDSLLNKTDVKTFNFATAGTFNPESYYLYDNFINNLDGKEMDYAFLELQSLFNFSKTNSQTTKGSYWNNLHYLNYSINYILASKDNNLRKNEFISNYSRSFIYSFLDFKILLNYLSLNSKKRIGLNGFYPLEKEMIETKGKNSLETRWVNFHSNPAVLKTRIEAAQKTKNLNSDNSINKYYLNYLNSLINKSKQKGVNLVFILPPRLSEGEYLELIPIVNLIPRQHVIKLNDPEKYKELYIEEYSFDIGHLNSEGANIFTNYLVHEFKKKM
jgi:hypothetical protein